MEKKLQKTYLTCCNLLIAQGLWQTHYQILSVILLKESIEPNKNLNMMRKNVKLVKYSHHNCFLEYTNFKDDLREYKYLCYNKSFQNKFNEKL